MTQTKLHSEFDSPEVSPGFLLWQISNKWQAEQRKALKPFGLTHVQFVLLASLTWATSQAAFNQKQLATHAKTDIMMTSQVVRVLEQKGLISRTVSKIDSRAYTLNPTNAGRALANKAIVAVEGVDKCFFERLYKDLPSFTKMMQQLAS